MLVFACISPHPPLILPDVGSAEDRQKVSPTIKALESLAPKLEAAKPELIIISSPHPDWGFNVPLHFLLNEVRPGTRSDLPIATYLTTLKSPQEHFEWGKQIANSLPKDKRLAWIASGDMSHRLTEDGPYGLHPSGPKFDKLFIELLKRKDIGQILNLPERLVEEAGECGLRSFCCLLGALDALRAFFTPEILSYEGPFGVGYLVVNFELSEIPRSSV